ncbi:hypothetical protein, partial [Streptomyces sp. DH37]|uniref:hypothetical protein n=1 Tax=Streptomyces sp. DH37 TaxID=3040122 RepID=UPI002442EB97
MLVVGRVRVSGSGVGVLGSVSGVAVVWGPVLVGGGVWGPVVRWVCGPVPVVVSGRSVPVVGGVVCGPVVRWVVGPVPVGVPVPVVVLWRVKLVVVCHLWWRLRPARWAVSKAGLVIRELAVPPATVFQFQS